MTEFSNRLAQIANYGKQVDFGKAARDSPVTVQGTQTTFTGGCGRSALGSRASTCSTSQRAPAFSVAALRATAGT
jgi:hypothetical protein